jgi:hypothetical protein
MKYTNIIEAASPVSIPSFFVQRYQAVYLSLRHGATPAADCAQRLYRPTRKKAVNILNNQSRTADKGVVVRLTDREQD